MSDPEHDDRSNDGVRDATPSQGRRGHSRRQVLRGLGAGAVAAGLAGCSTVVGGPRPLDEAWSIPLTVRPSDAVFNAFAAANATGVRFRYDPFARFDQTELAWTPVLATDWTVADGALELTLDGDREWTNSDPVTAGDVTALLDVLAAFEDPLVDLFSDWRAPDETTAVLSFEGTETNPRLLGHRLLSRRLTVNRSAFGDLAERAAAATDEAAREAVRSDVRARGREDLPTNGPYVVAEVADDRIRYAVSDAHPAASRDAQPALETPHRPSPSAQLDGIRNGDLDGHDDLQLAPGQGEQLPDHVDSVTVDGLGGNALFANYDDEWFGDPRVRRALAFLLDGPGLAAQVNGVPVTPSGMGSYVGVNNTDLRHGWFDDRETFTAYAQDRGRATRLLRDAGLERVDGVWTTPDGEALAAPITVAASWGVGSVIAQEVARQLGQAGIAAEVVRLGVDRFQRQWEAGEYRLAFANVDIDTWHPYAIYRHAFDGELARDGWAFPESVEVPMPPGDSESTTVNVRELTAELRRAGDEATERELVRRLGWVFNRTLPWIPANKTVHTAMLTSDHWSYPSTESDGQPSAAMRRLAPRVASSLATRGVLEQRFDSG